MPVSASNNPVPISTEPKQHGLTQSTRNAASSYRAETGGFGPHSGAKLLLTRTAGATETKESWRDRAAEFELRTEPADVARDKAETTCERHANPQTVAIPGVSTKKAQALNLSLIR
jgi:hypothetical protein